MIRTKATNRSVEQKLQTEGRVLFLYHSVSCCKSVAILCDVSFSQKMFSSKHTKVGSRGGMSSQVTSASCRCCVCHSSWCFCRLLQTQLIEI